MIYTETMRERKQIMETKSDAFVMVPGGIGTFDEFFEIITLKQLGRHNKPVAIFNINGYFDEIVAMLEKAANQGFMTEKSKTLAPVFADPRKLIDYLETAPSENSEYNLNEFKKIT